MSVKRLERTRGLWNAIAFSNSQFGLVRVIALASIPEGVSIIFLFNSLFSLRGADYSVMGIGIGVVVSLLLFYGAFSMSIQGDVKASIGLTLVAMVIAAGGWEIGFQDNGDAYSDSSNIAMLARRIVVYTFVVANSVFLGKNLHKLYLRNKETISYARAQEKELIGVFIDLGKEEFKYYKDVEAKELGMGNAKRRVKTNEQPRKKRIDPNLIKSLNSLPNG